MSWLRPAAAWLLGPLALDTLVLLVAGGSPLAAAGLGLVGHCLLLAALLWLRFRALAPPASKLRANTFVLLLLLLPALVQFEAVSSKLSGVDGISYYVFLRSMVKDRDFELSNEYAHYGMLERPDLSVPTKTGHRRSIYAVGPALVWTPFFLLGDLLARAAALATGQAADLSGYGDLHVNAVALGSLLYGFLAMLAIERLLSRHFSARTALAATLLCWGATSFHFYLVVQPTYAHNASTLLAAYALLLFDDRNRRGRSDAFYLGLVLGLAMCIRWQNGVLLLLPAWKLLRSLAERAEPLRALAAKAFLSAAGTALGALPQCLAWKALYDMWILPYPPQGTDFLRFDHPYLLETFFSSRHGLLSWTPALWAGYLGFLPLLWRRRTLVLPLLVPLALMSYVNACVGDWWAGGSFSNRRFDSLLPLFGLGFAGAIDAARRAVAARPLPALLLVAAPFVAWNLSLAAQLQRGLLPRDDTVAWSRLAGNAARVVSDAVGFPTTWPASWIFAWRHGLSPGRYDLASGRYLFYRQNSLGGVIDLANPDHASLLADGFAGVEQMGELRGRRVAGRGRLLAPLNDPEPLELRILAAAPETATRVTVSVNGREAGRFETRAGTAAPEHRLAVPAAFWRRELNEVALATDGGPLIVGSVRFVRVRR